jgi:hypothetical protein
MLDVLLFPILLSISIQIIINRLTLLEVDECSWGEGRSCWARAFHSLEVVCVVCILIILVDHLGLGCLVHPHLVVSWVILVNPTPAFAFLLVRNELGLKRRTLVVGDVTHRLLLVLVVTSSDRSCILFWARPSSHHRLWLSLGGANRLSISAFLSPKTTNRDMTCSRSPLLDILCHDIIYWSLVVQQLTRLCVAALRMDWACGLLAVQLMCACIISIS